MRNDILLLILVIIFIYILLFSYYSNRKREGWGAAVAWVDENIVQPVEDIANDWFLGPGQDLLDSIGELPNDIAEGVKEVDKIIDKMGGFTDDIEDAFNEVGELTNFPITFANEFGNEAANILNLVEEEAKEASNVLKDSVMSSFNVIQESVTTLSGEALNMITSIFARLGEIVSELFFMVLNTLKTVFESFGEDIANGFNEYLVNPLMQIFGTIGELFLSVFDQISVIATWIINIPYCVPFYIFDTMKDQIRDIIPNPILFIFDIFYIYILVPIFSIIKHILRLFGFNFKFKRINCYPWR
jgi:hypothetical protein